jgi:hypothetical protein
VGQVLLIIKVSRSHSDTPHSAGRLWTSDQSDAETSTGQHTHWQETNIHAIGGIRTHSFIKREAADPHIRLHGHRGISFVCARNYVLIKELGPSTREFLGIIFVLGFKNALHAIIVTAKKTSCSQFINILLFERVVWKAKDRCSKEQRLHIGKGRGKRRRKKNRMREDNTGNLRIT